jgi:AAA domain/Toprim-like
VLESVALICREVYWSEKGEDARAYLLSRGFTDEDARELGLGLYPSCADLWKRLKASGYAEVDIRESEAVFRRMEKYIVFPWADDRGSPLTLYGTWPSRTPPEETPKKMALANPRDADGDEDDRTKRSPLYLDRALAAGHRDLVLVEGVTDAALLQVRGDARAVACVAASLSKQQVETLARHKIRSVTIALDPDRAGDNGILSCVRQMRTAGIRSYVAPKLPDDLDPDDFVNRDGIDAWRAHIDRAVHAYRHQARVLLAQHGERQPGDDGWADDVLDAVRAFAAKQPVGSRAEMALHFAPEIEKALGLKWDDILDGLNDRAPDSEPKPEQPDRSYRFESLTSHAFFTGDYRLEWMVKRLLVKGQPGVFGGPKKALKTTIEMDLAISLASATPFLGHFDVYRPCRVVMISGESGEAVLQETGRRICAARGIDPTTLDVFWSFRLPQMASILDRGRLRDGLQEIGAGVVIIDPLYLCLLAGMDARGIEAGNLFSMGPLLLDLARTCLDVGCTPMLSHHAAGQKIRARGDEPMELEDLAFAGIQEFARQWVLINRREPFDPETGSSRLWLSGGGSAGQSGCWAMDVEEGVLADDFSGRKWEVAVRSATVQRQTGAEVKESQKEAQERQKARADDAALLLVLDRLDPQRVGANYTRVRDLAGMSGTRGSQAVARLVADGIVEELTLCVAIGSGAQRPTKGIRRKPIAASLGDQ